MSTHSLSTRSVVLLSLVAGLALGLLLGRLWTRQAEEEALRRWHRMQQAVAARADPRRHQEPGRQDSLAMLRASPPFAEGGFPREVRRIQAMDQCVVTFVFDRGGSSLELFEATAHGEMNLRLRRAWAFRDQGFPEGTAVNLVFPELDCGAITHFSVGLTRITIPEEPPVPRPRFLPPAPALPESPPTTS